MHSTPISNLTQDRSLKIKLRTAVIASLAAILALGLASSTTAFAQPNPSQLDNNAILGSDQNLSSPSGAYVLTMQDRDGNLVLYGPGHIALWAAGTSNPNNAHSVLINQGDGNLVIVAPGNHPIWASNTSGDGSTVLQVQDDGNTVLYAPGHVKVWATNTAQNPASCGSAAGPGTAVTRWNGVVTCVLSMLGQPQTSAYIDDVDIMIRYESAGNPNICNTTDSNAKKGTPSCGLIQVIQPTFNSWRSSQLPSSLTDPAANLYAGLNYGIHRYHSVPAIPGVAAVNNGQPYKPY